MRDGCSARERGLGGVLGPLGRLGPAEAIGDAVRLVSTMRDRYLTSRGRCFYALSLTGSFIEPP